MVLFQNVWNFKNIVICSGHTQTTCRSISSTHKFRSRHSNRFRTNRNVLASGKTSLLLDIVKAAESASQLDDMEQVRSLLDFQKIQKVLLLGSPKHKELS